MAPGAACLSVYCRARSRGANGPLLWTSRNWRKPVPNHRRLIGCLMLAACALLSASPAVADTFHVTSLADGGPGTLRSAIEQAPFGVDATTIVFDVEGTVNLTSPLFILAKIINIQGPGAATLVVSGNQTFPILRNISGSVTTISGVTIQNGRAVSNVNGAGIYNNATLTVADCVIAKIIRTTLAVAYTTS